MIAMFRRPSCSSRQPPRTRGAATVEFALVVPVFGMFCAALMEFGHVYLVVHTLNGAAKRAARYGAAEGISTAQVEERVNRVLGSAFSPAKVNVYIKDGALFDDSQSSPTGISYAALPDIELLDAETSDLFIVRLELAYEDVALLPPFWAKDLTLFGQSVMRHE